MTKFEPHHALMIRRPLMSINFLADFNRQISKHPELFEEKILAAFKNPALSEALQMASTELHKSLGELISGEQISGKAQILVALYKYLIRACSRCTPFGLFAGYAMSSLGEETKIEFDGGLLRYSSLTPQALAQIHKRLLRNTPVTNQTKVRLNTTMYLAGSAYRFWVTEPDTSMAQSAISIRQIQAEQYLHAIFNLCRNTTTVGNLISALAAHKIGTSSAETLLAELCELGAILFASEPPLSSYAHQNQLKDLANAGGDQQVVAIIDEVRRLNACRQNIPDRFDGLNGMLLGMGISGADAVQTDIAFGTRQSVFSRNLAAGLARQLDRLIVSDPDHDQSPLRHFIKDFQKRYETTWVPLMQALDPDTGIGYQGGMYCGEEAELLGDLMTNGLKPSIEYGEKPQWMDRAFRQAVSKPGSTFLISDRDLGSTDARPGNWVGEGISVLGSLISQDQKQLDKGKYLFELKGLSGPGSIHLMSRFGDSDPSVLAAIADINKIEQAPHQHYLFAEISYLPKGHQGNICRRPVLSAYQICYQTSSQTEQISLEDILVGVEKGRAVLFSRKHQKRIFPRLTSAHNFQLGPPIYHFLGCVANQGAPRLIINKHHFEAYPFFPRIQYGKVVLSKAFWRLYWQEINSQQDYRSNPVTWWNELAAQYNLPRYVMIGDGDRQLFIDGHCGVAVTILAEKLRERNSLVATEVLERTDEGLLKHHEGLYFNEVVLPLLGQPPGIDPARVAADNQPQAPMLTSKQGWLYLKLYASKATMQHLLSGTLATILAQMETAGKIQRWFFIRFEDPDPHLRLRLFAPNMIRSGPSIFERLLSVLACEIASGAVHRIQTQTYEREAGRYQALPYDQVEALFHIDSRAVLQMLTSPNLNDTVLRWAIAMIAADDILDVLGYDSLSKHRLVGLIVSGENKFHLDRLYRNHRHKLNLLFLDRQAADLADFQAVLKSRKEAMCQVWAKHHSGNNLASQDFAFDLIHLFCNRFFLSHQQLHERAIYHFLKKSYDYQLKSKKQTLQSFEL